MSCYGMYISHDLPLKYIIFSRVGEWKPGPPLSWTLQPWLPPFPAPEGRLTPTLRPRSTNNNPLVNVHKNSCERSTTLFMGKTWKHMETHGKNHGKTMETLPIHFDWTIFKSYFDRIRGYSDQFAGLWLGDGQSQQLQEVCHPFCWRM